MLIIDLGIFNKKSHVVSNKEAVIWSSVWISLAMIFSGLVYYYAGSAKFYEFQSAYWIEKALSVDNLFAAVAFTPNIILVCIGVFIGILAMRFIAQWFVKLMGKYPFLETAAFIVIAILGIKLTLSLYEHCYPESAVSIFLKSHTADIGISVLTVAIFFVPILTSIFFNYPKKQSEVQN